MILRKEIENAKIGNWKVEEVAFIEEFQDWVCSHTKHFIIFAVSYFFGIATGFIIAYEIVRGVS